MVIQHVTTKNVRRSIENYKSRSPVTAYAESM